MCIKIKIGKEKYREMEKELLDQMLHAVENCFKDSTTKLNPYTYSGKYPFIIFINPFYQ